MTRFFLGFCCSLFLFSCTNESENFDWLVGNWERVNGEEGFETFETWKKKDRYYSGLGYTLLKEDTIFKEELQLFEDNGQWILKVKGQNEAPTPFILTELNPEFFVAENDTNEFPKKIIYKIENDSLKANVSTSEFDVNFEFVKIQK